MIISKPHKKIMEFLKKKGFKIEVKKVLLRKDGVKYIIIPKHSKLNVGDLIKLIKIKKEDEE